MFCLLAQAQCALMPNFSLSMCMAFTRSVRTAKQNKVSSCHFSHTKEFNTASGFLKGGGGGGRAKQRSMGLGSVLLNSACAYTPRAMNCAILALCQVWLKPHNSPLFQTLRVPTMRKGLFFYST